MRRAFSALLVIVALSLASCAGSDSPNLTNQPLGAEVSAVQPATPSPAAETTPPTGGGSTNNHRMGPPLPPASPTPTPGAPPQTFPPAVINPVFNTVCGQSLQQFQSTLASMQQQGYVLLTLSMYGTPGAPAFAASFMLEGGSRSKAATQTVILAASRASALSQLATYEAQGWYATSISAVGETSSTSLFTILLQQGAPRSVVYLDQTFAEFGGTVSNSFRGYDNRVPVSLACYGTKQDSLVAAVFQANVQEVNWSIYWGTTESFVRSATEALSVIHQRIEATVPSAYGGFTTTWFDNAFGPQDVFYGLTEQQFQATAGQEAVKGYFPHTLHAVGSGTSARIWAVFTQQLYPTPRRWTVTGPAAPTSMTAFDAAMKAYMESQGMRAAALAVVKDGRLVFAHGYTLAEEGYPITLADSRFRIASTSKPLTSIAVHQLIQAGKLSLDDLMQDLLQVVSLQPGVYAQYWKQVRVWHLLSHVAGWDIDDAPPKGLGFDPMFYDPVIAQAAQVALPITKYIIASFMCPQLISFQPGTKWIYSNFSFSLLGQIVEKKTGLTYEEAVRKNVFAPLGVTVPVIGQSGLRDRLPGEVLYQEANASIEQDVLVAQGASVADCYGGYNIRNMDSHGGWVLRAMDYAKVLAAFDLGAANPLLQPAYVQMMWTSPNAVTQAAGMERGWFYQAEAGFGGKQTVAHFHNGWLSGNSALTVHREDGLSYVILFNQGGLPFPWLDAPGASIEKVANAITDWPTVDLFPTFGIPSFFP